MSQKYELTFLSLSEWDISCFRWNKNKSIEIKINLRFDLNKKQNRKNKSLWILSEIDSSHVVWPRKLHAPDWIHARTGSNATTYARAEAGRYDKIVLDERICLLSSGNKIEHETHLILDCQRYYSMRHIFLPKIETEIDDIRKLSHETLISSNRWILIITMLTFD